MNRSVVTGSKKNAAIPTLTILARTRVAVMQFGQWLLNTRYKNRVRSSGAFNLLPGHEILEQRQLLSIDVAVVYDQFGNTGGYSATRNQLANDTYADFNASVVPAWTLTSPSALSAYDVVVIGGDGYNNALANTSFASALRTWVDGGGGVVMTGFGTFGSTATSSFRSIIDPIIPVQFTAGWGFSGGNNSNPFYSSGNFTPSTHAITNNVAPFPIGNGWAPTEWSTSGSVDSVLDTGASLLGTLNGRVTAAAGTSGSGRSVWLGPAYTANSSGWGSRTGSLRVGSADRLLEQAVLWAATPQTALVDIVDVSPDPRSSSVSSVVVDFSGPIDLATFTHQDITLTRDGGADLVDDGVSVSRTGFSSYQISGLSSLTQLAGEYVLTISGATIDDANGDAVLGTQSDTWSNTGPVTILSSHPELDAAEVGTEEIVIAFSNELTSVPAGNPILLGTSSVYPAFSARQILDANPDATDGVYWFDSDGSGPNLPFQAYADMTTDGGGWMLAINSVLGSEAQSNDLATNISTPMLNAGHTRSLDYLAIDQLAEIRHEIDASNRSQGNLHGKYVGKYNAPLVGQGSWTFLAGHSNAGLLASNYGMTYQPTSFGSNWYGPAFSAIPSTPGNGFAGPAIGNDPSSLINSYRIWVREVSAPPSVNPTIPGSPPTGAADPGKYILAEAGLNRIHGDADDVNIPVDVSYNGSDNEATLTFSPLVGGSYRLTISDSLADLNGTNIDGDLDGLPGGDWQRDFLVNAAPSDISLSNTFVSENLPSGSLIGTLTTTDVNVGDSAAYSLVSGNGDSDNNLFSVVGDELRTAAVFDFEAGDSYSIRVRTVDSGGLSFEKTFLIGVEDLPEQTDSSAPASSVSTTGLNPLSGLYEIAVNYVDPMGPDGFTGSGVESVDIYYRVNPQSSASVVQLFGHVTLDPASLSGSATLAAALNASPGDVIQLWSVATDAAGNVENEVTPRTDYSFVIADTVGPETQVDSAVFDESAFIDLQVSGADVGGGNVDSIDVYVETNPGTEGSEITLVGTVGGGANTVSGTLQFPVPQDGVTRSYRFFSIGTDHLGNREGGSGTLDGDPGAGGDVLLADIMLSAPASDQIIGFDANGGLDNRSSVHSVDVLFNDEGFIDDLLDSLNDGDTTNDRIRLERLDLTGNSTGEFLQVPMVRDGLTLRLDFGAAGLQENGVYAIRVDMDGDTSNGFEDVRRFHRLLGDINGDGVVNTADLQKARLAYRNPALHSDADVDGDGDVDRYDLRFFSTFLRQTGVEKELLMLRDDLDD